MPSWPMPSVSISNTGRASPRRFPKRQADGTVLIKELVSVGATQAASGNGFFQGEYIGLEAAVKDSKRFSNEPGYLAYFTL